MKYKGVELKEITEPQLFNPPKPMLVWDDDENPSKLNVCAIVNREGFRVITERSAWRHCAEIPEEPKKLVTYRELARWLAEGKGEMQRGNMSMIFTSLSYASGLGNDPIDEFTLVRKWEASKWVTPTTEYLGLTD